MLLNLLKDEYQLKYKIKNAQVMQKLQSLCYTIENNTKITFTKKM